MNLKCDSLTVKYILSKQRKKANIKGSKKKNDKMSFYLPIWGMQYINFFDIKEQRIW